MRNNYIILFWKLFWLKSLALPGAGRISDDNELKFKNRKKTLHKTRGQFAIYIIPKLRRNLHKTRGPLWTQKCKEIFTKHKIRYEFKNEKKSSQNTRSVMNPKLRRNLHKTSGPVFENTCVRISASFGFEGKWASDLV